MPTNTSGKMQRCGCRPAAPTRSSSTSPAPPNCVSSRSRSPSRLTSRGRPRRPSPIVPGTRCRAGWRNRRGRPVLRFEAPPADARFIVHATDLGAARPGLGEVRAPGPAPVRTFHGLRRGRPQGTKRRSPCATHVGRGPGAADSLVDASPAGEPRSDHPGCAWARGWADRRAGPGLRFDRQGRLRPRGGAAAWSPGRRGVVVRAELRDAHHRGRPLHHGDGLRLAVRHAHRGPAGALRRAMVEHALEPIAEAGGECSGRPCWWTNWYHCNWGAVDLWTGRRRRARPARRRPGGRRTGCGSSQRKIWHYTALPRGGWKLGRERHLWRFRAGPTPSASRTRSAASPGYDLFRAPRLRQAPRLVHLPCASPSGASFVPFSNCQKGTGSAAALLFRLAAEYRDGQAQTVAPPDRGAAGPPTSSPSSGTIPR